MSSAGALWLLATLPIFLGAASMSRLYAGNAHLPVLVGALTLYCVGNVMMVPVLRDSGLALAISISSIAQLLLVNLVAFLVFGERLSSVQMIGMVLGSLGLVLMILPTGPR